MNVANEGKLNVVGNCEAPESSVTSDASATLSTSTCGVVFSSKDPNAKPPETRLDMPVAESCLAV